AGVGPSGTVVMPASATTAPLFGGRVSKSVALGVAAFVVVAAVRVFFLSGRQQRWTRDQAMSAEPPAAVEEAATPSDGVPALVFGPVIERVIEFTNSSRRALNLSSGNFVTPGAEFVPGPDAEVARAAGADLYFPQQ